MSDFMIDLSGENLDDAKPLSAVPEGEYSLRIINWKADDDAKIVLKNRKDMPFVMPIFEIFGCPEEEYAKNIMHYLPLPHPDMTAKERNNALFNLKEFCVAFGIDYRQPIDPEATIGLTGDAFLIVQDDDEYGESNRIKRFVTGH